VPPAFYDAFLKESIDNERIQIIGPNGGLMFDGVEVYPDPTVTEFTAR
jgi:hypothetical protein